MKMGYAKSVIEKGLGLISRGKGRVTLMVLLLLSMLTACSQRGWTAESRGPKAPNFPSNFAWINTPEPLSFTHQLKRQVVLLDFWTYGCINCIHMFPVLDRLQRHFANQPFLIIGVHSAKFAAESRPRNVRAAVMRYKIDHPVIVDENMQIWNAYGVDSWPTFVLVGAGGHIDGSVAGEVNYRSLKKAISQQLKYDRKHHLLARHPLVFPIRDQEYSASGLAFPGKVLASARLKRLFIADTDHNRIVETRLPNQAGVAKLIAIFGNGKSGRRNGSAKECEFNSPQGMALLGDTLYVADTNNHLIRAINLKTDIVRTILGTGSEVFDFAGGGKGTQQGINSPWALAGRGHTLYIAMAGEHQIWKFNTQTLVARAYAGSGFEGLENGVGLAAEMAQPSGLALRGHYLYVAEPEASAVAQINLRSRQVRTIVGQGLFTFGDRDGSLTSALLQHCMGVAAWGRTRLLVADTYNDKLRLINLKSRRVTTFAGIGKAGTGHIGGPVEFAEPGGLSVMGHTIFVADTDNQRIVILNGKTGHWRQLVITGLRAGTNSAKPSHLALRLDRIPTVNAEFASGAKVYLTAHLKIPHGTHLTVGVPISIRITTPSGKLIFETTAESKGNPVIQFILPAGLPTGAWLTEVYYDYCTNATMGQCVPATCAWKVEVEAGTGRKIELKLSHASFRGFIP
ncbi:MAG: thioredoxin-like domain-containing protein [Phycisphaerae bacterium]